MMCLYTYTTEEAVFLIGWSALLFVVGYLSRKYHIMKEKNENVFTVEKVVSQPLELQCRLQFDREFPEDMKQEFIYRRLCEELQKVFKENSDICLIQTEDSLFDMSQNVRVKVRLLPYIHGSEY